MLSAIYKIIAISLILPIAIISSFVIAIEFNSLVLMYISCGLWCGALVYISECK
jgi:hypothetical protein